MRSNSGFSLIEILMVIALLGILSWMTLSPVSENVDQARYDQTLTKMEKIRDALIGRDPEHASRSHFGYAGDLGNLPTSAQGIAALWTKPGGVISWTLDSASRIGSGWNGPYLAHQGDSGVNYTIDSWGTPFSYDPDASPPVLTSLGADRIAGGTGLNSDIHMILNPAAILGTLHGVVQSTGAPWTGTGEMEINYPDGDHGSLKQKTTSIHAADAGAFQFTSIPLGARSITLYLPNKGSPSATLGPFMVKLDRPHSLVILGTAEHPLDLSASP